MTSTVQHFVCFPPLQVICQRYKQVICLIWVYVLSGAGFWWIWGLDKDGTHNILPSLTVLQFLYLTDYLSKISKTMGNWADHQLLFILCIFKLLSVYVPKLFRHFRMGEKNSNSSPWDTQKQIMQRHGNTSK